MYLGILGGCWKHPIRATEAPLWIGSANEKPATPEAWPSTQSVKSCPGLEAKRVFPARAAFDVEGGKGCD